MNRAQEAVLAWLNRGEPTDMEGCPVEVDEVEALVRRGDELSAVAAAACCRADEAQRVTNALVVLARKLGASEGQLARAYGSRLGVREVLDDAGIQ